MPKIYKVIDEDSEGNTWLWGSSAEIVGFNSSNTRNLSAGNVQRGIEVMNEKVEEKTKMLTFTTTIVANRFTGSTAPYAQTIEVAGILGTDSPDIGVKLASDVGTALQQQEAFGCITQIETGVGIIVVKCYEEKPRVDIPIQIRVLR